jgi:hypothetical protein
MDQLKYALQINEALQLAYEEQKFGSSKRRFDLEEMYKPLVGMLGSNESDSFVPWSPDLTSNRIIITQPLL